MRHCATNMSGLAEPLRTRAGWATIPLEATLALPPAAQIRVLRSLDLVAVNTDGRLLMEVAAKLMAVRGRARLIGIDILLPRPDGPVGRVRQHLARHLLRRVQRFYLFQRDVVDLDRFYGIGPRCEYVPFKSNAWDRITRGDLVPTDAGYVLHAGRTHRDLRCFLAACRYQAVPTRLLLQAPKSLRQHGTANDVVAVPPWVEVVRDEDSRDSFEAHLAAARLVVVTVRPGTITPAGCGTLFDAMALGKCTIISDGPATRGIIDSTCAVIVPPGDPVALGAAVRRFNTDHEARQQIGAAARIRAQLFRGADRLHADLVKRILASQ